ncbi:MAG: histidine kinase [Sphingomicrobium sp.]
MWRFLAGALASMLMMFGAFLIWKGQAEQPERLPPPPPRSAAPSMIAESPPPPEATPKTREQKRFDRADKNKDGKIELQELLQPRRKPFAKLDENGDGRLSFDEWAVRTIDKFHGADKDRSKILTRAEYATTAPKPRKKKSCSC